MGVKINLGAINAFTKGPEVSALLLMAANQGAAAARSMAPVDTGTLRDSIHAELVGPGQARYGTDLDYAEHVEFGTYKMSAQPFMRPSVSAIKL